MDWTSLYFKTSDLNVFILGTGEVATRRANKFLAHGANVKLAGNNLDDELVSKGASLVSINDVEKFVQWSDVVIIASGDRELSNHVSKLAKNKLLNRADFPDGGNIIVPTSFNIGDVEISIFTNGKSPLMARHLRKKIQSVITKEDILEIEIQDYARKLLKSKVHNQKKRKNCLYQIFNNNHIRELIDDQKINEAKVYVEDLVRGFDDT